MKKKLLSLITILAFASLSIPHSFAITCGFGTETSAGSGICRGFLLTTNNSAAQSWGVPSDWNSLNNTIEAVGAGGTGSVGAAGGAGGTGQGGGGGGAYAKVSNITLTPSSTAGFRIASTGNGAGTALCTDVANCLSGTHTEFIFACDGNTGSGATGGAGGATSTCGGLNPIGTIFFIGGTGGTGGGAGANSGSGGGAAGLHGRGNNGVTNGQGGCGDLCNTASTTAATIGNNGTQWNGAACSGNCGSGSGGGSTSGAGAGKAGGTYGAAGAGGRSSGNAGGVGQQGIIVITYTPVVIGVKILTLINSTTTIRNGTLTIKSR